MVHFLSPFFLFLLVLFLLFVKMLCYLLLHILLCLLMFVVSSLRLFQLLFYVLYDLQSTLFRLLPISSFEQTITHFLSKENKAHIYAYLVTSIVFMGTTLATCSPTYLTSFRFHK